MANASGKALDKTHLSIDQAEERGFIHRDYIAHCLRWSHVAKFLNQGNLYKTANILDVGCGKEVPLAKLLYSSRLVPVSGSYTGVDANRLVVPHTFHTGKFPIQLISGVFPQAIDEIQEELFKGSKADDEPLILKYDVITCFEVAEHVEPKVTLLILEGIKRYLDINGTAFLSTPCYDSNMGAAANHVNEMSYQAFGAMIEHAGLHIESVFGTFASIKDYKDELKRWPGLEKVFEALRSYYDSNYLATVLAPLFPGHSRNCLWRVVQKGPASAHKFDELKTYKAGGNSSSTTWEEFINGLEASA